MIPGSAHTSRAGHRPGTMEPDTRYTLVGAAVLGLVAAAIAMLVWLSDAGSSRDARFYTIVFERQSLEGLHCDALALAVTLAGNDPESADVPLACLQGGELRLGHVTIVPPG